jgi:hypothetical protein
VLLYFLLASALERKDHEVIETRLRACAAVYDNGGLDALQEFVQSSRDADKPRTFFVRMAAVSGIVLLMNFPDDWVQFDPLALKPGGDISRLVWLRIPQDAERDFTIASMRLSDNSVLEVGRSTSNREVVLQAFRLNFLAVRRHGA